MSDNKTACERRCGARFSGAVIPFGAGITYLPITDKDKKHVHQFGSKLLWGIFLGYEQQEGGGWNGDLLFLDWEQIENALHLSDIHIKRFRASEVTVPKVGWSFRLPLAEGALRQPGSERYRTQKEKNLLYWDAGGPAAFYGGNL